MKMRFLTGIFMCNLRAFLCAIYMCVCLLDRVESGGGLSVTYCHCRHLVETVTIQYLPFADVKALATYDAFERSAYQLVSAER